MDRNGRRRLVGLALAMGVLAAGCGSDHDGGTKAGGSGPPIVLRLATAELEGRPGALPIEEFARQVETRSGGSITIEPQYGGIGNGDGDDWDQQAARAVVSGEYDLGLIPARAWDTEGVTSLRALHAPFLVDSDAMVEEIVTGGIADDLLDGLGEAGIVGLALLPEGMRHVFGFDAPLVAPDDYAGVPIRVPMSATAYALFEALGAEPDDFAGQTAIGAGAGGAETSFLLAPELTPENVSTAGNVVPFPKVNTLVANAERFEALSDDQRDVLTAAAIAARDWARGSVVPDVELADEYCRAGRGSVIVATDAELAALVEAAAQVYEELERDPATGELLERLRELKDSVPAPMTPRACAVEPEPDVDATGSEAESSDGTSPDPVTAGETSDIDGIYRYEVTAEMFEAKGVEPDTAPGVRTVTIENGTIRDDGPADNCVGTFTADGERFTFRWDRGVPGNCSGDWAMTLLATGDEVRWGEIESLPPLDDPVTQAFNEIYNSVPWTRIGDVG